MADADFNVKAIISAQTSQFEKGIKNAQSSINTMSKSIEGVQKLLKTAFSVVGITASVGAIINFGKKTIQSATQAQKAFNILDNTIKATGADAWTSTKEMDQMAKTLSDSTNYAVTEIESMQSVLLGFRNITGETFEEASEAIMDMATVMGMDLKSATQVVGKALDDPIKGLDSLRRQGFQFTEEQKAELTQLVKNGKQLEAQKIILNELSNSYGGAAKSGQDSFAKQRHAIENFSDTLGSKLIPIINIFAENNTKMLNNFRELIEKTDFTPVVNTIKNLNKIFTSAFENISNYLNKTNEEVVDFISRFNFKPIISIVDTLAGAIITVFNKIKNRLDESSSKMKQFKESLIEFSNSETFQKIANVVNSIIDVVFFLWDEIEKVLGEIGTLIGNTIIIIWNKIKELFEKSQNALANSTSDIKSWGDYFYFVFNEVFRTVQDLINGVSALLHGDWAVAWEYAKLSVLRLLNIIPTTLNTIREIVSENLEEMFESIFRKVGIFLPENIKALISSTAEELKPTVEKNTTAVDRLIKETEDNIQKLTGHTADVAIKDLQGVSTQFSGFTTDALGFIQDLTEGTEEETKKQKKYFNGVTSDGESTYKKFSEWDLKLLQQRLEGLNEWSDEYHRIQLDMIEAERQKAHDADQDGSETEKINKYYNNKIEKENERHEKAKREKARETFHIMTSYLKTFVKDTIAGFKKVIDTIKKVFSTIGNFVRNVFDKFKNIFSTIFEFNIDDTLNNLLKIEDAILTFFVETLPKLPNFFESAFSSVLILIQNLINSIDWDSFKNILDSIINIFIKHAPEIVKGIGDVFVNLIKTISKVLVDNAPEIVNAFGQIFFTILEALPSIISNFIKFIGTYLSQIGRYFADNFDKIAEDLSKMIESLVDGIAEFISNGGWKNLLDGLLAIQKAIEKAITDNIDDIVDTIIDSLPDLVDMLIESIVSASKTLAKLIRPIIKLILAIISALIDVLTSDEVMDASLDAVMALIEAIFDELLPGIIKLIPKLIIKVIAQVIKNFPKIVKSIVQGLINAFTKTNWIQVVKDIFTGFIDAFKELFGIHSPSTLFESFGINIIEGLVNGLKGISEAVLVILEPLANTIDTLFSGLFDSIEKITDISFSGLSKTIKSIGSSVKSIINSLVDGIVKINESVGGLIKSTADLIQGLKEMPLIGGGSGGGSGSSGINDPWDVLDPFHLFPGHAIGTNATRKGLAIVGEAGPELVRFNGGEQVLNNRNTNKALENMGGNTNNFNVTFNNLQDTSAFAMMNQLKQYNRQMAINGVI